MCQLGKLAAVWRAASNLASLCQGKKRSGNPRKAVRIARIDFQALSWVWFHDGPADRKKSCFSQRCRGVEFLVSLGASLFELVLHPPKSHAVFFKGGFTFLQFCGECVRITNRT